MECRYILLKNVIELRVCYGIAAVADFDDCTSCLQAYIDLSSDESMVSELVEACNRNNLYLIQLRDVVEDFLTNQ